MFRSCRTIGHSQWDEGTCMACFSPRLYSSSFCLVLETLHKLVGWVTTWFCKWLINMYACGSLACMGASWTFARPGSEWKSIEVNGLTGWALDT